MEHGGPERQRARRARGGGRTLPRGFGVSQNCQEGLELGFEDEQSCQVGAREPGRAGRACAEPGAAPAAPQRARMARGEARPRRERRQAEPGCPTPSLGLLRGVPSTDAPAFVSIGAGRNASALRARLFFATRPLGQDAAHAFSAAANGTAIMAACHDGSLPSLSRPHGLSWPRHRVARRDVSPFMHALSSGHASSIMSSIMHQSCINHAA